MRLDLGYLHSMVRPDVDKTDSSWLAASSTSSQMPFCASTSWQPVIETVCGDSGPTGTPYTRGAEVNYFYKATQAPGILGFDRHTQFVSQHPRLRPQFVIKS
jgi:hypothetical protein